MFDETPFIFYTIPKYNNYVLVVTMGSSRDVHSRVQRGQLGYGG